MVCMSQSMSQNHDDSNICICIQLMVHIPVFIDYIYCIPSYYRFLLEKPTLPSLIFWELYSYMSVVQNVLNVPFLAYKICHVVRMTSSHDYNLYSLRSQLKVKHKSINMVHPPINQTIPNIAISMGGQMW